MHGSEARSVSVNKYDFKRRPEVREMPGRRLRDVTSKRLPGVSRVREMPAFLLRRIQN